MNKLDAGVLSVELLLVIFEWSLEEITDWQYLVFDRFCNYFCKKKT
ncbi:hypothetical protein I3843_06G069300 [Carya illinoinensis]|nr:hypothetical protein I3760_06G075800 [Carya illinoinensis]KAG7948151.1 hypothetical protein I3843_14G133000 [Carya illinoinensis]KAG7974872.1 hypothetical protein I3843_06G069300 [Carya illinoinensis]